MHQNAFELSGCWDSVLTTFNCWHVQWGSKQQTSNHLRHRVNPAVVRGPVGLSFESCVLIGIAWRRPTNLRIRMK